MIRLGFLRPAKRKNHTDGSAQTESLKDLRIYTAGARKRKSGSSYLGLSHPFSRMAEQRVGHLMT